MNIQTISITPSEGAFGFNIKYDEEKIKIPGYSCDVYFFLEDDEDEKSELRFILEEDFGCSYTQVNLIKGFINNKMSGIINDDETYTGI